MIFFFFSLISSSLELLVEILQLVCYQVVYSALPTTPSFRRCVQLLCTLHLYALFLNKFRCWKSVLIKCFKKFSFRNSPSSQPVSWRPHAPQPERTSDAWEMSAPPMALCFSRYQSPFQSDLPRVPAGWGLSRVLSSLRHTISHVF